MTINIPVIPTNQPCLSPNKAKTKVTIRVAAIAQAKAIAAATEAAVILVAMKARATTAETAAAVTLVAMKARATTAETAAAITLVANAGAAYTTNVVDAAADNAGVKASTQTYANLVASEAGTNIGTTESETPAKVTVASQVNVYNAFTAHLPANFNTYFAAITPTFQAFKAHSEATLARTTTATETDHIAAFTTGVNATADIIVYGDNARAFANGAKIVADNFAARTTAYSITSFEVGSNAASNFIKHFAGVIDTDAACTAAFTLATIDATAASIDDFKTAAASFDDFTTAATSCDNFTAFAANAHAAQVATTAKAVNTIATQIAADIAVYSDAAQVALTTQAPNTISFIHAANAAAFAAGGKVAIIETTIDASCAGKATAFATNVAAHSASLAAGAQAIATVFIARAKVDDTDAFDGGMRQAMVTADKATPLNASLKYLKVATAFATGTQSITDYIMNPHPAHYFNKGRSTTQANHAVAFAAGVRATTDIGGTDIANFVAGANAIADTITAEIASYDPSIFTAGLKAADDYIKGLEVGTVDIAASFTAGFKAYTSYPPNAKAAANVSADTALARTLASTYAFSTQTIILTKADNATVITQDSNAMVIIQAANSAAFAAGANAADFATRDAETTAFATNPAAFAAGGKLADLVYSAVTTYSCADWAAYNAAHRARVASNFAAGAQTIAATIAAGTNATNIAAFNAGIKSIKIAYRAFDSIRPDVEIDMRLQTLAAFAAGIKTAATYTTSLRT